LNDSIKRYNFPTKPTDEVSKKLVKKYPNIKVYADKKTKEVKYFVFTDKDGFIVVITLIGKNHNGLPSNRVYASYKGKFEVDFHLPGKFANEMPDVINSVIDLVSTFNPKHYANQSLSLKADEEVEKTSSELFKQTKSKSSKTKS
jgi:hypothetical protein